jgi:hypothetical protein
VTEQKSRKMGKNRLEAFSDGVIARACQIFCVERGHEIMPKGLFHDRSDDHQEA